MAFFLSQRFVLGPCSYIQSKKCKKISETNPIVIIINCFDTQVHKKKKITTLVIRLAS